MTPDETAARQRALEWRVATLAAALQEASLMVKGALGATLLDTEYERGLLLKWAALIHVDDAPPPEALTPEEWSLIDKSLERTTSCDRKFPMGTRQLGPFIDLLVKLRRRRPVAEGK